MRLDRQLQFRLCRVLLALDQREAELLQQTADHREQFGSGKPGINPGPGFCGAGGIVRTGNYLAIISPMHTREPTPYGTDRFIVRWSSSPAGVRKRSGRNAFGSAMQLMMDNSGRKNRKTQELLTVGSI